jgi:hypothetical protein
VVPYVAIVRKKGLEFEAEYSCSNMQPATLSMMCFMFVLTLYKIMVRPKFVQIYKKKA